MVRFARRNFLVPVPQVRALEELNAQLRDRCRDDWARHLRGQPGPKGLLLQEDQAAFLPLPATPFEACRKLSTTANSLSLVRFDRNDYSVPVGFAHQPVVVKGFVERVEICRFEQVIWLRVFRAGGERAKPVIARHARRWGAEGGSFDPVHYWALLERKPGALDHARPLADWALPECFTVLRRRQEAEWDGEGTREYIGVLRLLERHALSALQVAVEKALRVNALTRDAIAQFLIPQEDWRQTTFRLEGHEHLRHVKIGPTVIAGYGDLLSEGGRP